MFRLPDGSPVELRGFKWGTKPEEDKPGWPTNGAPDDHPDGAPGPADGQASNWWPEAGDGNGTMGSNGGHNGEGAAGARWGVSGDGGRGAPAPSGPPWNGSGARTASRPLTGRPGAARRHG